jgi:hypothetical protein
LKRLALIFIGFFCLLSTGFSQDSCSLRISLLTCAPGDELYSTFGHTALRVQDLSKGLDLIYNYGTFEFAPDFYIKFIRGKLLYSLSVEEFNEFMYEYKLESRSVQEQVLNLSCTEKEKLFTALQTNALEQNRYYKYDFLFDNCTTRAKDIVARNTVQPVLFKNILPSQTPTFRNLIHGYLNSGKEYWSKLGIDILLGAKLDKKVSNEQSMFLPDNLLKGFDKAITGGHPLASAPQTILAMPSPLKETAVFTPTLVFSLLLAIIIALFLVKTRWATAVLKTFDFLYFFILGLAGILLLFMWFGTDHKVCQNNYNLLWALPSHVVMAFYIAGKKDRARKYFTVVFWLSLVLLVAWFFLPQQMNNALLPLIILILFRSWHLSKLDPYGKKRNPS